MDQNNSKKQPQAKSWGPHESNEWINNHVQRFWQRKLEKLSDRVRGKECNAT